MRNSHKTTVKKYSTDENNILRKRAVGGILSHAMTKSIAEPGNSNLTKGEQHAQRAFFVRSTRTPKERLETLRGSECPNELGMSVFGHTQILSMVACNGKGSPFADFLWCQFSSLLHVTAQTLESLAVALINQPKDTVMKRFKFLTGSRLIVTIYANNRQEAENKIKWTSKPLLVARLRNPLVNNSQNPTACDTEQNNSLLSVGSCGHNDLTTTNDGNRNRYTSGIFLPKIHQINGNTKPLIYSELAVRATPRNKADTIRTNKGGYSFVAVEPLSHPFSDKPLSLTKTNDTMNKSTQTPKGIIAKLTAFPFVLSAEKGACYA
ncbi:host cell division inhibitor Icd-like protein [Mannheimia indoligenes]|uniref:host cell division inhibitor Icd-like protein n=1 Tax=Mannheimia indoligenes TaxID=3103145 RepID=UPI002FE68183